MLLNSRIVASRKLGSGALLGREEKDGRADFPTNRDVEIVRLALQAFQLLFSGFTTGFRSDL